MPKSNDADIVKIVHDVAPNFEIDLDDLREDLDWSHTWFETRQAVSDRRRLATKLTSVEKAALRLEKLLDDAEIGPIIGPFLAVADARGWLQRIAKAAVPPKLQQDSVSATVEAELADELGFARRSAFEWLVGERLPQIYQKHFKTQAGFSRNPRTGSVSGPYIRFVQSTLQKYSIDNRGKPYSAESVAKGLTEARAGNSRKKPDRQSKGQPTPK